MNRRHLLGAGTLALCGFSLNSPVWAANAAEDFVSASILKGFDVLNDANVPTAERRQRFATFLLGLTDVRRVALFLLGSYAAKADPADIDAYVAAYRDYINSVYQSYFALYAGQSLRVVSSRERAPGDYVVSTQIMGGNAATPIDFRVKTDGPQPLLLDVAVSGVWLGLAQRDQFMSVLAAKQWRCESTDVASAQHGARLAARNFPELLFQKLQLESSRRCMYLHERWG